MEVSNKMAARCDLSILELELIFRQMFSRISLSFFPFWPECFTACFGFSSMEPTSSAFIMVPVILSVGLVLGDVHADLLTDTRKLHDKVLEIPFLCVSETASVRLTLALGPSSSSFLTTSATFSSPLHLSLRIDNSH